MIQKTTFRKETKIDGLLVVSTVRESWPMKKPEVGKPYSPKRSSAS